jgi:hypothetical protein
MTVGVRSMHNGKDGHRVAWFVDSIDDPVCTTTGAVSIGQWRSESLPDPAGLSSNGPTMNS